MIINLHKIVTKTIFLLLYKEFLSNGIEYNFSSNKNELEAVN